MFREDRSPRLSRLCARLGPDQIDTGYVLFIDGGYLTMIEGFTFDGDWPKQVEPATFYWIEETPTLR